MRTWLWLMSKFLNMYMLHIGQSVQGLSGSNSFVWTDIMNSFNYQTLSFNNADYSYGSNGSMQQSTSYLPQSVTNPCDYNCICCARFHVGNPCPCNTPKTSIGTQTDLEVPQGLDSERFWKCWTYEHSIAVVQVNL